MAAERAILDKTYSEPFVLDRGKLSRMLTIMEQEAKETSTQFQPGFEIVFENNKRVVLHSIEEVFSLDNSLKNPVRTLEIEARFTSQTEKPRVESRVYLRFDSIQSSNISIRVVSPDSKQAMELFAELEEQIDRTIVTNWIVRYLKSTSGPLFMAMALTVAAVTVSFEQMISHIRPSSTESGELQRLLSSARTDSEKIAALVQVKIRELNTADTSSTGHLNWAAIFSLRGAFIALPVIVLVVTVAYLIAFCYPRVVFAWGDWEEHYNSLLSRRKMLGGVIVAALFIGIMANLFVASIPPLR